MFFVFDYLITPQISFVFSAKWKQREMDTMRLLAFGKKTRLLYFYGSWKYIMGAQSWQLASLLAVLIHDGSILPVLIRQYMENFDVYEGNSVNLIKLVNICKSFKIRFYDDFYVAGILCKYICVKSFIKQCISTIFDTEIFFI